MKYYLVDTAYSIDRDKLLIHLFSRDENLNFIEHILPAFNPYCYLGLVGSKLASNLEYVNLEPGYKSWEGEWIQKAIVHFPREISTLRSYLARKKEYNVFEGDIEYKLRYIINKGIKTGYKLVDNEPIPIDFIAPPRICFLDIEVFSRKVSRYTEPVEPVIIIGMYDSYINKYILFIAKKLLLKTKPLQEILKSEPRSIEICGASSEKELFKMFSLKLEDLNPDLFISFTRYDLRYLIKRMEYIGFNSKSLSRLGNPYVVSKRGNIKLRGRGYLDLQFGYRVLSGKTVKWESLDAICKRELGYGKLAIGSIYDAWLANPALVVKYNLRDVELIKELDLKKGISEYFISLKNMIGCPIEYTYNTTSRTDILNLRKCYKRYVLPNRKLVRYIDGIPAQAWSYKGALVAEPVPGVHEYVADLDFTSQYPSIMKTWNISLETFSPAGDLIIDENHRFRSTPKGVAVEIIEDFQKLRKEKQKEIKKAYLEKDYELLKKLKIQERSIKTCMEGAYGQFGAKGNAEKGYKASRIFNPSIAEAIPIPARDLVTESIRICEELGYQIIYGDTDSIFIKLKEADKDFVVTEAEWLRETIQKKLVKFIKDRWKVKRSAITIGIDKIFSVLILYPVKKRYDGLYFYYKGDMLDKEERETKGIETIRADTAKISESMIENLNTMILHRTDNKLIYDYLYTLYNDIKAGKYSWLDLGIPARMAKKEYKKLPIQKRTADYSNAYLGTNIEPGMRFYRIWIKSTPPGYPYTNAIAYTKNTKIPAGFEIDYDRMANDLVAKKSREILKLIGINPEDIFPGKKKKKSRKRKKGKSLITLDSFLE